MPFRRHEQKPGSSWLPSGVSRKSIPHGHAHQAVLRLLASGEPRTAAEIAAATGLSRSTVVQALDRLSSTGAVVSRGAGRRTRGRPSRLWTVASAPGPIAVVVASAHGTAVGVVTPVGEVLAQRDTDLLPADEGRHAGPLLEALDETLSAAGCSASELSMAVVGLPGPSDFASRGPHRAARPRSGHLRRFRIWDGGSPVECLQRHLGCRVYAENDANLASLAEALLGAGAAHETVLHVNLRHGTGAGLVIRGRLHRGTGGLAGEIGHLHSDDSGPLCQCGARGCFWQSRSLSALLDQLSETHGQRMTTHDVAHAAAAEDQDVVRALRDFGHALGRRLADAAVYLNPGAITVDGGLGGASTVIADGVRQGVQRYAPPTIAQATSVLVGACGEAASLIGGAGLAHSEGLFRAGPAV